MGASGIIAQMVLLREMLIVYSGNELSIGIILANWLILEAAGAWISGKLADRIVSKTEWFVLVTLLFSLTLPAAVFGVRVVKHLAGYALGETMGLHLVLLSSFLILLPVSLLHGALFPLESRLTAESRNRAFKPATGNEDAGSGNLHQAVAIGNAYVYETIGTFAGGILWTWILISHFQSFTLVLGLAVLNSGIGLMLLRSRRHGVHTAGSISVHGPAGKILPWFSGILLVGITVFTATGGAGMLHQVSLRQQFRNMNVVDYRNSRYGNICVVENEDQYSFFTDGTMALITPVPDIAWLEQFVHLPLLSHPNPQSILIIGGGAGGAIANMLKHPQVHSITYTELDPGLLDSIARHPTALSDFELNHPALETLRIDGRLHLQRSDRRYDLVMVGVREPSDLQTNRLFTREFFTLARQRLNSPGMLVLGVPGSLVFTDENTANLNSSIHATIKTVFPYLRVFPGDEMHLMIASDSVELIELDSDLLISRIRERQLLEGLAVPWRLEQLLLPQWQDWYRQLIAEGSTRINRDFRPGGLFYFLAWQNSLYTPRMGTLFRVLERFTPLYITVLLLGIILTTVSARLLKPALFGRGIAVCIGTTGFSGMLFNLTLIFSFQCLFGHVYSWIGLLTASFMSGAALGAGTINRVMDRIKNPEKAFAVTELAVGGLSLFFLSVLYPLFAGRIPVTLFPVAQVLFLPFSLVSGASTGIQFPLANRLALLSGGVPGKTAGLLYAADLIGGWFGGLLTAVVLLPVTGLYGSLFLIVLIKSGSCLLFGLQKPQRQPGGRLT